MTIEPVNSVMSLQIQSATPREITPKTESVTTEGQMLDIKPMVDESTPAVESASSEADAGQDSEQPSPEQFRQAAEQLSKSLSNNTEAQFGIHEATKRITIKLVDKSTKEVIKELPAEKTLDLIAKAWEIAGLLVDERR